MAQRVAALSPAERLAQRLDDPATADALNELLDHADLVALIVTGFSEFLQRGDTMADSIAEGLRDIKTVVTSSAGSSDIGALIKQAGPLLRSLETALPTMQGLLEPGPGGVGILDVAAIVGRAASTGTAAAEAADARTGPLGLLRAMRDDDVRRALAFGVAFAKALGSELRGAAASTGKHGA